MNVLFIGIREDEQDITSGPKKVANTLFNTLRKQDKNVYFYGLPWEDGNKGKSSDYEIANEYEVEGSMRHIAKFIREKNINVVYLARYYSILALFLCSLKLIYRFKLVYTVHGIIKKEKEINKSFKTYSILFEKMILRYSDKIVVITEDSKKELIKSYPSLCEKKITVINNGVSILPLSEKIDIKAVYNLRKQDKIIFTIGTRKIKNIETVIDNFINSNLYNSCVLLIAGENDTEYARYLISKYIGYNKVVFTGNMNPNILNNAYSQCDIFVQVSKFETFGMSIVEALLHKKNVVISSKLPISQCFSDEEVCFYNEEKDELSNKMLYCLDKLPYENEKGFQRAKDLFDWKNISQQYFEAFESTYYAK
ncbi:glycosyltransferase [Clostridium swellfunianum]|uniref:glycosyltransferase n=1 Tax=Clostridium swellfunianum TaxID=1367462 RepID=UPI00202EA50A|nr:glycosyltransferase [Clostridium swellfunianum]MCM0650585.1 glycosyltransferase [Clostridium swellfunianum]